MKDYQKKRVIEGRNHKVTSCLIERYQDKLIKEQGLNLSHLMRDLLDGYLEQKFPKRFKDLKRAQLTETYEKLQAEKLQAGK